ncbi:MAG: hypothetical protein JO106_08185 [Mycobacterium sp.]|nr:hypothetical protein [Mycobacterium sp.]
MASGGRLLGLHTDLARSPSALAAYLGLRRAAADYATLDPGLARRSCSPSARLTAATTRKPSPPNSASGLG